MIIQNFKPFVGQHCETTATGSLLNQLGIELSEPLLFGLGEGLSYIFWNMKIMDFPFIGGRVKPDVLTQNICRNLNLTLAVKETSSIKKAWNNVQNSLEQGKAVGLKLDCYHLEYFSSKIHFAGHYVAMYGYDEEFAHLVDTVQQGGKVKTTLKSLELARNEKGPMSSKNKSYTIEKSGELPDLQEAIKKAISTNASEYLNPPIKNISYKGIAKTATEIKKWFKQSKNVKRDFQTTSTLMERAGTGGSIFRNLYRDFLQESYDVLKIDGIHEAHEDFKEIAKRWKSISDLFYEAGETSDVTYIHEASEILLNLAERERIAMEKLRNACA
ncbi:MAG: BtrH N-terminal domain-containing protein [Flammeovirgaceae bacterium]